MQAAGDGGEVVERVWPFTHLSDMLLLMMMMS